MQCFVDKISKQIPVSGDVEGESC